MSDLFLYSLYNRPLVLKMQEMFKFDINERFEATDQDEYLATFDEFKSHPMKFLKDSLTIKTICNELSLYVNQ